jgi:hypothetical protein
MDAVGADEDVACDRPAVGERHGQPVTVLLEGLDARIQMDAGVTEGVDQNVEQVGSVNLVVGRAEMCLCLLAERSPTEALAGVPRTVVSPLGVDGDARQRPGQPQVRSTRVAFALSWMPAPTSRKPSACSKSGVSMPRCLMADRSPRRDESSTACQL